MRKKTKALLLSVLVFPGTGQFSLKRYKSAAFFICTSLLAIFFIALDILKRATAITDRIITGEIQAEYSIIRDLITEQSANSDSHLITILMVLLVAMWLISIIDILIIKNTAH